MITFPNFPDGPIVDHCINHLNERIMVEPLGERQAGGGFGAYKLSVTGESTCDPVTIQLQSGNPVADINGFSIEALIAIGLNQLRGYQNTDFNCKENACAITKLEEALLWMGKRARARRQRGVEGTSKI